MLTILIVAFIAFAVVHVAPKLFTNLVSLDSMLESPLPEPDDTSVVHLFSGPNDGEVHEVIGTLPSFFVSPYMPKDEDGNPAPDEHNIMHAGNGMMYMRPSLAYYQQVTDNDYIYVRDISETEMRKIQITGELPKFKVDS